MIVGLNIFELFELNTMSDSGVVALSDFKLREKYSTCGVLGDFERFSELHRCCGLSYGLKYFFTLLFKIFSSPVGIS